MLLLLLVVLLLLHVQMLLTGPILLLLVVLLLLHVRMPMTIPILLLVLLLLRTRMLLMSPILLFLVFLLLLHVRIPLSGPTLLSMAPAVLPFSLAPLFPLTVVCQIRLVGVGVFSLSRKHQYKDSLCHREEVAIIVMVEYAVENLLANAYQGKCLVLQ